MAALESFRKENNKAKLNMNAVGKQIFEESDRDLAAGILRQAAQDLRRFHGATSPSKKALYIDAYSWMAADDCRWPFSFLNTCQLLNLEPEIVRRRILGDMSLGWFRYWTRRCLRPMRRPFQILLNRVFTRNCASTPVDPIPLTYALQ